VYSLKSEVFPSIFLILMGAIDAITTVIGVMYYGATELNPFMSGIVNTNIMAFLFLKVTATLLIGFTYILAKRTLNKTLDKDTRSFKISNRLIKVAYGGLTLFLIATVTNNITVLLV
jgi:hypothetical protein